MIFGPAPPVQTGPGQSGWSCLAVLGRTHQDLAQVRALAEGAGIPVRWCAERDKTPPLHQVREVHRFLRRLAETRGALTRASDLLRLAGDFPPANSANPWARFLQRTLAAWRDESDDAELPAQEALEFLHESCAEARRDFSFGEGVVLSTVHAAKGTEHAHVLLIGGWAASGDRATQEEVRRAFYVGMTRARHSLAVFERADVGPALSTALAGPWVLRREAAGAAATPAPAATGYAMLGLDDINLGHAAFFKAGHPVHTALNRLQAGDRLSLRADAHGLALFDSADVCVGRLSRKAVAEWQPRLPEVREVRVLALLHRGADQDEDDARRARYLAPEWEVPWVEVVSGAVPP